MWYTYKGVLFGLKKEWDPYPCCNMDGHWRHAKCNKPDTKRQTLYYSTDKNVHTVVKFIQIEWSVVYQGMGGGKWTVIFSWYSDSVWDDEKVLKLESGGCCTTLQLYFNASELYPWNCQNVQF